MLLLVVSYPVGAIERIVSLAPSSTELVYSAGLGDKLVGVSTYSDYPPQAKNIEQVADFHSINMEKIISLQPDLIVAIKSGGLTKPLTRLAQLGFPIYYTDADQLDDITRHVEYLSRLSDHPETGIKRAENFHRRVEALRQQYQNATPVHYFYQLSESPIYTMSGTHWPSDIFTLCGGVNVFNNAPIAYPQVGFEQVLSKQPDVIFYSNHTQLDMSTWNAWKDQLPAVQHHSVWLLNSDWLNRPTLRSLEAIEQVCNDLDKARNN